MDVFSVPRISKHANRFGLTSAGAFDLQLGHDFLKESDRKLVMQHIEQNKPQLVIVQPPCEMFSVMRNISKHKVKPDTEGEARSYAVCYGYMSCSAQQQQVLSI
jgi:hypothetical protein